MGLPKVTASSGSTPLHILNINIRSIYSCISDLFRVHFEQTAIYFYIMFYFWALNTHLFCIFTIYWHDSEKNLGSCFWWNYYFKVIFPGNRVQLNIQYVEIELPSRIKNDLFSSHKFYKSYSLQNKQCNND